MKRILCNFVVGGGLMFAALAACSQPITVGTWAGQTAAGSADGAGYQARFNHPNGIAADASGNVFVADTVNSTIRKISPAGIVSTFAGSAGNPGSANGTGTNAQFYAPQGITVDGAGNLYVADTANATIRKITSAGVVTTLAGLAGTFNSFDGTGTNAQFYQPQAVAVDGAGNVYVADAWNQTIRKITAAGVVSTLAGLAGYPGAADGTNSRARFNQPSGIALDSATNLFVTDFLNHTVRKISPAGTVSTIAGSAGVWGSADGTNSAARFYHPVGIVVDGSGNFIVADSGNQTLRKISPSGTNWVVTTVAGFPGNAGSSDGAGTSAQFSFPAGLARDGAGHLYVADSGNNLIRTDQIVTPSLQFSTPNHQLVLSWTAAAYGYVLESSSAVTPSAIWTPQTNGIVLVGGNFVVTNPVSGAAAFYRLHK